MRKKIPCKVIRSFSLSADGLSVPLHDIDFSKDIDIVTFHSTPGMFTYDVQLQKSFITYDKASCPQIIDFYV